MVKTIRKNTFWETKIGIIPMDWRIVSLDETSTLHARIGWQGLTTAEYRTVGKFKLVSGTNFTNGKINWETCNYIDKYRFEQDTNIQLRNEDVLVTKDGTIGKIAYVEMDNEKATLNSGVFVVRPKRNTYYPKFMYYIFSSDYFIEFLNKLTAGSTIVHLYQKDFINFKYPLPSMKEQQKIATALSDMDDLIESLEKIIEKKKKIKQGTMQQLLTGEKRLPGFDNRWINKSLGEIVNFTNGKAHEKAITEHGEYIVVNSRFISTEGKVIRYSDEKYCPASKEDILMVMSDVPNGRAIAKCFYVKKDNIYTVNQRVCILQSTEVHSKFLYYLLDRNTYFLSFDDGAQQTNLSKVDVLNCPLSIPSQIEEQQ